MVLYFFECSEEDQAVLPELVAQADLPAAQAKYLPEKLTAENASQFSDAEAISVFINSPLTKEIIDTLPNLKFIETRSTGFDHIDLAHAQSKHIPVATVPAYGSRTVAEYTFALMLGLSRKALSAYRQMKDTHNFDISQFEGFNLQGKTLGIVGTGRIGQNVAQIAKGFDMKLLGFDAFPNQEAAAKLGFTYVPLEQLLSQSDIVTLHVPYNKDTHHLINQQNITQFKKGSILINTSRGEVAETEAVLYGIEHGILAAVGMDVIEGEHQLQDEWHLLADPTAHQEQIKTLLEDHVLIDLPQVAYTPHIAFYSTEAKREILQTSVDNIAGFMKGEIKNLVK